MSPLPSEPVPEIRRRLLAGMTDFMTGDEDDPDFDCGYTQADVDDCAAIVDTYLADVASKHNAGDDQILAAIETAVLQLNALNERCDCGLIETDQREDLCQLILTAARQAGLTTDEDVTEPWREW